MHDTAHFEGVPVARLSKTKIPLEHQFEVLKQTTAPLFNVTPVGDPRSVSCSMASYLVEQLTFTQASFDEIQVIRTSQHFSHHGPDCLALQYFYSGGLQGTLDSGEPLQMASDVISIQDFSHPFRSLAQSNNFLSILIPRHAIAIHDQMYQQYPTFSWPVNSPVGRVLTQSWLTLWENLPNTSQMDAPAIAQGFIGLLNGLLSGLSPAQSHMAEPVAAPIALATEDAMKAYLRENLHLPNDSVTMLCQTFHCSRATVHRLFKSEGGVHAYVRGESDRL